VAKTELKTVVVVDRSDPEKRFEKPYMGVPIASFTLNNGIVEAVSHAKAVPYLVDTAQKRGLVNPLSREHVTMQDGLKFMAALLARVGTSAYLKAYALGPDNSAVRFSLTSDGRLEFG